MKLREEIYVDEQRLAGVCRRHGVVELAVFGSVLGEDFRPDSDIDVLVKFAPDVAPTWGGARLALDLEVVFGRRVDLGEVASLHWVIRPKVVAEAKVLHAAA